MSKFKKFINNLLAFYKDTLSMYIMHNLAKRTICEN